MKDMNMRESAVSDSKAMREPELRDAHETAVKPPEVHIEPLMMTPEGFDWESFTGLPKASPYALGKLASETSDTELLEVLATHPHNHVRGRVGQNPFTPLTLIQALLISEDCGSRKAILNPQIPSSWLYDWALDKYENASDLASNEHLSEEQMFQLIEKFGRDARSELARNQSIPLSILSWLWDNDRFTRSSLIKQPHCPVELMNEQAKLGSNSDWDSLARNPNTPRETLVWIQDRTKQGSFRWQKLLEHPNLAD